MVPSYRTRMSTIYCKRGMAWPSHLYFLKDPQIFLCYLEKVSVTAIWFPTIDTCMHVNEFIKFVFGGCFAHTMYRKHPGELISELK